MTKLIEKTLAAFAMLTIVLATLPVNALPTDSVTDTLSDPIDRVEEADPPSKKKEDAGGVEKIVDDVADTAVDPASSKVDKTAKDLGDGAKAVENTADRVVPGDVKIVDSVQEAAEPVTSGKTVDKLVEDGGELVGDAEEKVYSAPIVGEAAKKVVDTAEPAVDQLTDAAEPVVDPLEEETAKEVENLKGGASNVKDALQETTSGTITEGELVDDVKEKVKDLEGSISNIEEAANDVISKGGIVDSAIEQHRDDKIGEKATDVIHKLAIPNPDLTEKEKEEIIEEAMSVSGVRKWSSYGWQFVGMDFVGKGKSSDVEWQRAIVYLHLPDGAGNPPQECFQGWSAAIDVSLETRKAENSGYPTESSSCTSAVILKDPVTEMLDSLSSLFAHHTGKTSVNPSFVIAEASDVTTNDVYGNTAYLKTPSYEPEIFDHMDRYIAHLLNQKWKTSPTEHMAQMGWLITTVEGCADCGTGHIAENTGALVFTDTSLFGNLEARRIPFDWKADEDLLASTTCNDEANYLISMQYGGNIFNHNTNVPCENADNDSETSNSLFFENWNTVESSSWARDITGKVEAHSAYAFINSHEQLGHWTSSANKEQRCDSSRDSTAVISESLSGGKAASWAELDKVPPAC